MWTSERARAGRAAGAITAVYTAFLLCAQFGFLAQLEAAWGRDSTRLQVVLAAMGAGGLAGSLLAAWRSRRGRPSRDVRSGLLAVALATAATLVASTPAVAALVAAALGGALGFATVALAGGLPSLVAPSMIGRVAGGGTGLAYAISNLPPLFAGSPAVRALLPAALALAAAAASPVEADRGSDERGASAAPEPALRFAGLVALFAALVLVDSAAFAHVQKSPELLASTWGGGGNQLRQGAAHLLAALLAGAWLDRGGLRALLGTTAATFAVALPALGDPRAAPLAGVAYAAGISLYSAALVAAPGLSGARGRSAARRAAALYVTAGWIASGLGVGAADAGAFRGVAVAGACGAALFLGLEVATRRRAATALAPALLAGVAGGLLLAGPRPGPVAAAPVPGPAAGREVYLAEGCQHCHSEYVRPLEPERLWWGPARGLDRSERPPTPGNRRLGPDLSSVGARRSDLWQSLHLRDPRTVSPASRMPSYGHLFADGSGRGEALVAYLGSLGGDRVAERDAAVAEWRPADGVAAGSAERGAGLFRRHCAPCHGPSGRGDGAMAEALGSRPSMDLTDGRYVRALPRPGDRPDDALARAIRFGLPPGSMPGHEWLSDREVADLVVRVRSLESGAGPR